MFDQPPQRLSAKDMSVGPKLSDLPHHELFQKGCSELHRTIFNNSQIAAKGEGKKNLKVMGSNLSGGGLPQELVKEIAKSESKFKYKDSKNNSWSQFVLHDVNSAMELVSGIRTIPEYFLKYKSELYTEEIKAFEKKLEDFTTNSKKIPDAKNLSEKIDGDFFNLIQLYKQYRPLLNIPEEAEQSFQNHLNKADSIVKLWPLLSSSSHLLHAVSQQDDKEILQRRNELLAMSVPLSDILDVSNKRVKPETIQAHEDVRVDGITAIMVHNLLKNAQRYSTQFVDITVGQDGIVISNDTRSIPDANKLFQPEKPQGADSNTGYGLFTAKKIFGPLGGKDIEFKKVSDSVVSFTIKPLIQKTLQTTSELMDSSVETPKRSDFEQRRKILTQVVLEKAKNDLATKGKKTLAEYEDENWGNVILHDARNPITVLSTYDLLASALTDDVELQEFSKRHSHSLRVSENTQSTTDEKLEAIQSMMGYFKAHLLDKELKLPPSLKGVEKLIQSSKTTARIWSMLNHSSNLISSLSKNNNFAVEKNAKLLTETNVFTRDIIKKVGNESIIVRGLDRDQKIDGAKGIILFNLIKNANKHHQSTVKVSFKGDEITVYNDSETPFDEKIFSHPGNPGVNGHTGYGLFISKNIFGLLGGYDIVVNGGTSKDIGPPYNVSFTIKPVRE